jgi:hypothetical protein
LLKNHFPEKSSRSFKKVLTIKNKNVWKEIRRSFFLLKKDILQFAKKNLGRRLCAFFSWQTFGTEGSLFPLVHTRLFCFIAYINR